MSKEPFKITPITLDTPGIHFNMFQISPEVMRAQRQAELEQIAKYRAIKIAKYQKWSDPIEGEKWRAEIKAEEQESRKELHKIPADLISVRTKDANVPFPFEMKPLLKPQPSAVTQTRWARIKSWFAKLFRGNCKTC